MLELHPEAAIEKNRDGRHALHEAARGGCDHPELVGALLGNAPSSALGERCNAGNLPLHWALSHGAKAGLVRQLLDAHPGSIAEGNSAGDLALHLAARHGASTQVVRWLLTGHPGGAGRPNRGEQRSLS